MSNLGASAATDGPDCRDVQRIEASLAVLGEGMPIRRALPTRLRRLIGPWCFLDHFGPHELGDGPGVRVGPHPHIGLQTVTWMLQGELLHRDSLGRVQVIRPGQLNLMTAGRGISHSEESPQPHSLSVHGLQFWIALPPAARTMAPAFDHYPELPQRPFEGLHVTVFAGAGFGLVSPARVHSPLVGADLHWPAAATSRLPLDASFEHGLLVAEGALEIESETLAPGTLLYLPSGHRSLHLRANGQTRAALVGGVPYGADLVMWWNFVAGSKAELSRACRDWNQGAEHFGRVSGYDGKPLVAPLPPWDQA